MVLLVIILSISISWCNTINQEKNETSNDGGKTQPNNVFVNTNETWIVLYIDKNCEDSQVQPCQPKIWEQQFGQILWSWNKLNIKYFNENNVNTIKNILWASPVLVIPENQISVFWQQSEDIKQHAKKENWNYYLALYNWIPSEENICNDEKDNNNDSKIDKEDPTCLSMTILTSSWCKEQYCNEDYIKNILMWYNTKIIHYNTEEWKKLYEQLWTWQTLPTFLLNEEKKYMENMKDFFKDININWYKKQLNFPDFKYDPTIEICETDCNASTSCSKILACNKKDIPDIDLFVMSYCPYGTQAEKWIIPAANILWKKINFNVKFVDYIMHEKKEIDENTLQYCIQQEQKEKIISYLTCFLEEWKSDDCKKKEKINMKKINNCIKETDKKYNITWLYNDKSTWRWNFPSYPIYTEENKQYDVQWSPTLIINWIKTEPSSRSPQSYLDSICEWFKTKPVECEQKLSDQSYDPMWGWTQNWKQAPAWSCGGN